MALLLWVVVRGGGRKSRCGLLEALAHLSGVLLIAPPSTFPQKPENAGRARWLDARRGLARYEENVAQALIARNQNAVIGCAENLS